MRDNFDAAVQHGVTGLGQRIDTRAVIEDRCTTRSRVLPGNGQGTDSDKFYRRICSDQRRADTDNNGIAHLLWYGEPWLAARVSERDITGNTYADKEYDADRAATDVFRIALTHGGTGRIYQLAGTTDIRPGQSLTGQDQTTPAKARQCQGVSHVAATAWLCHFPVVPVY